MFTLKQIETMCEIQDKLNSVIDPNWKELDWNFLLAAKMEAAEAVEHYGWKWWKKQTPDLNQVRMELVDILHFLLSDTIRTYLNPEAVWFGICHMFMPSNSQLSTLIAIVDNTGNKNAIWHLTNAFHAFSMSGDEVFKMYIGKYCLNNFRQANGYKDGSYIKVWADGREDNEHLTDILNNTPTDTPNLTEHVLEALTAAYTINN